MQCVINPPPVTTCMCQECAQHRGALFAQWRGRSSTAPTSMTNAHCIAKMRIPQYNAIHMNTEPRDFETQ